MNLLQVLLHFGSLSKALKDAEQTLAALYKTLDDLFTKKAAGQDVATLKTDALAALEDLGTLLASGLVPLPPGLSASDAPAVVQQLKAFVSGL